MTGDSQKDLASERSQDKIKSECEFEEEFVPATIFDSFRKDLESKSIKRDEIKKRLNQICTSVLSTPVKAQSNKGIKPKNSTQFNRDKSVMDCSKLSEKYIQELMAEFTEQQARLETRKKELQTDLNQWNLEMKTELDNQLTELSLKQKRLSELEAENSNLSKKLETTDVDFKKQTKQLLVERKNLDLREQELDKKVREYETKRNEFDTRLNKIEIESKKLREQRKKLFDAQHKFAKQVSDFEEVVKKDTQKKESDEPMGSEEELSSEWLKLHEEEKRLEGIRSDLMLVKDQFIKRLTTEREELVSEREALVEEWDKVKRVRNNLKCAMPNIESKLKELFKSEGKSTIKLLTKGQLAKFERKIQALEEKFVDELTELLANQQLTRSDEIENEWSKLHAKEEKLDNIRTEMLEVKNQIIEKYTKQRDELNLERKKLEDKWEKLCKIQKQITEKESQLLAEKESESVTGKEKQKKENVKDLKDSGISDISKDLKKSTKLDKNLRDLQKELRSEWEELHSQHDRLTQIISEVSKAKLLFEKGKKLKK